MAVSRQPADREPRLDPVRWRPPHGAALARAALTIALLLTAAWLFYARDDPPGAAPVASSRPQAPPGAGSAPPDTGGPPTPAGVGEADARRSGTGPGDRLPVPAGSVGVPVRLIEPATLAVVRPGDRVDLLAIPANGRPGTVAADALVLGVAADPEGVPGGAVYLALTREQAERTVGADGRTRFAALIRP
ncbi:MAG TPA: flagellar biosynthesis protein FlgA [Catenuloplanes sp.]|jgi:hypothetical protein